MRISTYQIYQQGVNSMLTQQASLAKTQQQLSTGNNILSPGDDPAGATQVLKLTELIDVNAQYQRNADAAETRLLYEENVLSQAGDLLQRARELAVQGLNDVNSASDRRAISFEIRELLDELLQTANSKDSEGDYLFGGFRSSTEPFSHDGLGNFTYNGDQGQPVVQIGPSRRVATGDSGEAVFMRIDDGAGGVSDMFSVLYDLATGLEADAPSSNTLTRLDSAIESVLTTRASVGARLNSVENQRSTNDSFDELLQGNRSTLQDLDYASAVSRFERQTLALQASQQSFVKIAGLSLFNFL